MPDSKQQGEQRWTIYVCSDCGEPGYKFVSEHSIPLVCSDPESAYPGEHSGKPQEVAVVPAATLIETKKTLIAVEVARAQAQERLDRAIEEIKRQHLYAKNRPAAFRRGPCSCEWCSR